MTKTVPWTRPIEGRVIIEALSSGARRKVLKILLESRGGVTASEVATKLGLSLSTVIEHLNKLVDAGIARVVARRRDGRLIKVYVVPERYIVLEVDLLSLTSAPEDEELRPLMVRYVKEARRAGQLPPSPTVGEVKEVLGIGEGEALALVDYLKLNEEEVVTMLSREARGLIRDGMSLNDLGRELRVHRYWAVKVARRLEEEGACMVEDGTIKIT